MLRPEFHQQVVQQPIGQAVGACDLEVSREAGVPPGDVPVECKRFLFHAFSGQQHPLARVCRTIGAAIPLKQLNLRPSLQRVQPSKDGGVVMAKCLGGPFE